MAQLCAAGGSPSTEALQTGLKGGNTSMQKAILSFNYHSSTRWVPGQEVRGSWPFTRSNVSISHGTGQ